MGRPSPAAFNLEHTFESRRAEAPTRESTRPPPRLSSVGFRPKSRRHDELRQQNVAHDTHMPCAQRAPGALRSSTCVLRRRAVASGGRTRPLTCVAKTVWRFQVTSPTIQQVRRWRCAYRRCGLMIVPNSADRYERNLSLLGIRRWNLKLLMMRSPATHDESAALGDLDMVDL